MCLTILLALRRFDGLVSAYSHFTGLPQVQFHHIAITSLSLKDSNMPSKKDMIALPSGICREISPGSKRPKTSHPVVTPFLSMVSAPGTISRGEVISRPAHTHTQTHLNVRLDVRMGSRRGTGVARTEKGHERHNGDIQRRESAYANANHAEIPNSDLAN